MVGPRQIQAVWRTQDPYGNFTPSWPDTSASKWPSETADAKAKATSSSLGWDGWVGFWDFLFNVKWSKTSGFLMVLNGFQWLSNDLFKAGFAVRCLGQRRDATVIFQKA